MNDILIWFKENWELILPLLISLIALLRAVAHLTPTDKDDQIVDRLEAFIQTLIKVFTKTPIQTQAKFDELNEKGNSSRGA